MLRPRGFLASVECYEGPGLDLHVLLWELAAGGLQAASALGHRRLLTVVQLLQAGVSVEEEPHASPSAASATLCWRLTASLRVFLRAGQMLSVQRLQIEARLSGFPHRQNLKEKTSWFHCRGSLKSTGKSWSWSSSWTRTRTRTRTRLVPWRRSLCGSWNKAEEQKPDSGQPCGGGRAGGAAGCSGAPQRWTPHRWSPGKQTTPPPLTPGSPTGSDEL